MENSGNLFDVSKKNILLTGATGFFGRYFSRGLLENGANVILLGRSDKLIEQTKKYKEEFGKERVNSFQVDFYKRKELKNCLEKIANEFDVHVLINNAYDISERTGFNSPKGRLENSTYNQWKSAFESGIYWAVLGTQIIGKQFIKKNINGSIINIDSMYGGVVSPGPELYKGTDKFNPPSYSVMKAGLLALTKYTASFLGKDNIRCNAISPGPFSNTEEESYNSVNKDDPFLERLKERTLLHRIGHPKELIGAVVYLSSDASSYMTGQNLIIDGGWTTI